jgi:hypothetical protein
MFSSWNRLAPAVAEAIATILIQSFHTATNASIPDRATITPVSKYGIKEIKFAMRLARWFS